MPYQNAPSHPDSPFYDFLKDQLSNLQGISYQMKQMDDFIRVGFSQPGVKDPLIMDLTEGPGVKVGDRPYRTIADYSSSGYGGVYGAEVIAKSLEEQTFKNPEEAFLDYPRAAFAPELLEMTRSPTRNLSRAKAFGYYGSVQVAGGIAQLGRPVTDEYTQREQASRIRVGLSDIGDRSGLWKAIQGRVEAAAQLPYSERTSQERMFAGLVGSAPYSEEKSSGGGFSFRSTGTIQRSGLPGDYAYDVFGYGATAADRIKRAAIAAGGAGLREKAIGLELDPTGKSLIPSDPRYTTGTTWNESAGLRWSNTIRSGETVRGSAVVIPGSFAMQGQIAEGATAVYRNPVPEVFTFARPGRTRGYDIPYENLLDVAKYKFDFGIMKEVRGDEGEVRYEKQRDLRGAVIEGGTTATIGTYTYPTKEGPVTRPLRMSPLITETITGDPTLNVPPGFTTSTGEGHPGVGFDEQGRPNLPRDYVATGRYAQAFERAFGGEVNMGTKGPVSIGVPTALHTWWSMKGNAWKQTSYQASEPIVGGQPRPYAPVVSLRGGGAAEVNAFTGMPKVPGAAFRGAFEYWDVGRQAEAFSLLPGREGQVMSRYAQMKQAGTSSGEVTPLNQEEYTRYWAKKTGQEYVQGVTEPLLFQELQQRVESLPVKESIERFGHGWVSDVQTMPIGAMQKEEFDWYQSQAIGGAKLAAKERGVSITDAQARRQAGQVWTGGQVEGAQEGVYEGSQKGPGLYTTMVASPVPEYMSKAPLVGYEEMAAISAIDPRLAEQFGLGADQGPGATGYRPPHMAAWSQIGDIYRYRSQRGYTETRGEGEPLTKRLRPTPTNATQVTSEQTRQLVTEIENQGKFPDFEKMAKITGGTGPLVHPDTGELLVHPLAMRDVTQNKFPGTSFEEPLSRAAKLYPEAAREWAKGQYYDKMSEEEYSLLAGSPLHEPRMQGKAMGGLQAEFRQIYELSKSGTLQKEASAAMASQAIAGRFGFGTGQGIFGMVMQPDRMRQAFRQMSTLAPEGEVRKQFALMNAQWRDFGQLPGLMMGEPVVQRQGGAAAVNIMSPEFLRTQGINFAQGSQVRGDVLTQGNALITGVTGQVGAVATMQNRDADADQALAMILAKNDPVLGYLVSNNPNVLKALGATSSEKIGMIEQTLEASVGNEQFNITQKAFAETVNLRRGRGGWGILKGKESVGTAPWKELWGEGQWQLGTEGAMGGAYNLRRLVESSATALGFGEEAVTYGQTGMGKSYQEPLDRLRATQSNLETVMNSLTLTAERSERAKIIAKTGPEGGWKEQWAGGEGGTSFNKWFTNFLVGRVEGDTGYMPAGQALMFAKQGAGIEEVKALGQRIQEKGLDKAMFGEGGYAYQEGYDILRTPIGSAGLTMMAGRLFGWEGKGPRYGEVAGGLELPTKEVVKGQRIPYPASGNLQGVAIGELQNEPVLRNTQILYGLSKRVQPATPFEINDLGLAAENLPGGRESGAFGLRKWFAQNEGWRDVQAVAMTEWDPNMPMSERQDRALRTGMEHGQVAPQKTRVSLSEIQAGGETLKFDIPGTMYTQEDIRKRLIDRAAEPGSALAFDVSIGKAGGLKISEVLSELKTKPSSGRPEAYKESQEVQDLDRERIKARTELRKVKAGKEYDEERAGARSYLDTKAHAYGKARSEDYKQSPQGLYEKDIVHQFSRERSRMIKAGEQVPIETTDMVLSAQHSVASAVPLNEDVLMRMEQSLGIAGETVQAAPPPAAQPGGTGAPPPIKPPGTPGGPRDPGGPKGPEKPGQGGTPFMGGMGSDYFDRMQQAVGGGIAQGLAQQAIKAEVFHFGQGTTGTELARKFYGGVQELGRLAKGWESGGAGFLPALYKQLEASGTGFSADDLAKVQQGGRYDILAEHMAKAFEADPGGMRDFYTEQYRAGTVQDLAKARPRIRAAEQARRTGRVPGLGGMDREWMERAIQETEGGDRPVGMGVLAAADLQEFAKREGIAGEKSLKGIPAGDRPAILKETNELANSFNKLRKAVDDGTISEKERVRQTRDLQLKDVGISKRTVASQIAAQTGYVEGMDPSDPGFEEGLTRLRGLQDQYGKLDLAESKIRKPPTAMAKGSQALRKMIGGWGLFYMGHLARLGLAPMQAGYQEYQEYAMQTDQMAQAAFGPDVVEPYAGPEMFRQRGLIRSGGGAWGAIQRAGATGMGTPLQDLSAAALGGVGGYGLLMHTAGAMGSAGITGAAGLGAAAPAIGLGIAGAMLIGQQVGYAQDPMGSMIQAGATRAKGGAWNEFSASWRMAGPQAAWLMDNEGTLPDLYAIPPDSPEGQMQIFSNMVDQFEGGQMPMTARQRTAQESMNMLQAESGIGATGRQAGFGGAPPIKGLSEKEQQIVAQMFGGTETKGLEHLAPDLKAQLGFMALRAGRPDIEGIGRLGTAIQSGRDVFGAAEQMYALTGGGPATTEQRFNFALDFLSQDMPEARLAQIQAGQGLMAQTPGLLYDTQGMQPNQVMALAEDEYAPIAGGANQEQFLERKQLQNVRRRFGLATTVDPAIYKRSQEWEPQDFTRWTQRNMMEQRGAAIGQKLAGAGLGTGAIQSVVGRAEQDLGAMEFTEQLFNFNPIRLTQAAMEGKIPNLFASMDINQQGAITGLPWGTTSLRRGTGIGPDSARGQATQIWGDRWQDTEWGEAAVTGIETPSGDTVAGMRGLQWLQRNKAAEYQAQQAGLQKQQLQLGFAFQTGVGLGGYDTVDPRTGQAFDIQGSGGMWGVQDRQRALQHQQQQWGFEYQERTFEMQGRQFNENMALQRTGQLMRREWKQEDWGYQDLTRNMQWGWKQEDFQEQVRFMSGRERKLAERGMERETIMFNLEGDQIEKGRDRQKELWRLEDERFELTKKHFQESRKLQEENMQKQKEFYEEGKRLSDQQLELTRAYYIEQYELSMQQAEAAAAYAEDMREINDAMTELGQQQQDYTGQLKVAMTDTTALINALAKGYNHLINEIEKGGQLGMWAGPSSGKPKDPKPGSDSEIGLAIGGPALPMQPYLVGEQTELISNKPLSIMPNAELRALFLGGKELPDPFGTNEYLATNNRSKREREPQTIIINIGNRRLGEFVLDTVSNELEVR